MKRLARSWLVAGSLTLTLAACGGGGGGGDAKPTAIENDSQAVQAANAVILISSGGIESLSGLVGAKAAKQVVANAQAKFFPQVDLAPLTLQRAKVKAAAAEDCVVTGTVSYTWVYDEVTGDYEETYIYDKCDDGWGAVINGKEYSKRTTVGDKVTEIWVMGNGDDVIQTSDYTITMGSSVQTFSLTAQDVYTITGTDYSSTFSFRGKIQLKDTDVDVSTLLSVNLSGTDQWTETATKDEGTATLNGSLSVSGKAEGQDFGVSFSFKNMKDQYSYSWVPPYEDTSAPEGTMTVSFQPADCFGGTFNIQTITPITIQNDVPISGEITINDSTSVSYNNGIITVVRDGAPEPAFVGTEEQLAVAISEDCPLFGTM